MKRKCERWCSLGGSAGGVTSLGCSTVIDVPAPPPQHTHARMPCYRCIYIYIIEKSGSFTAEVQVTLSSLGGVQI
jgi:hypothetical protein